MIRVRFAEPGDPAWEKWKADGAKKVLAHLADVQAGRKPKISDALYKKMRDVIFAAYHGKCAYCEALIKVDQPGDVEHFRPKGEVSDENWQLVEVAGGPHPGYWWLAYDWRNLLPSCARCNRPTKTAAGVLVGKGTRFPVGASWAVDDAGIGAERPRFLHPVFDDPSAHLGFDPSTGVIFWKSSRGKACVTLLDLNREGLPEARADAYMAAESHVIAGLQLLVQGDTAGARRRFDKLMDYRRGTQPYSLAGRKAIRDRSAELKQLRDAL